MIDKSDLVKKYWGKTLASTDYEPDGEGLFLMKDFTNFSKLECILGEIYDHEATPTREGMKFLEEYYGFEKLAKMLLQADWYSHDFKSIQEIQEWLEWWKNNEDMLK